MGRGGQFILKWIIDMLNQQETTPLGAISDALLTISSLTIAVDKMPLFYSEIYAILTKLIQCDGFVVAINSDGNDLLDNVWAIANQNNGDRVDNLIQASLNADQLCLCRHVQSQKTALLADHNKVTELTKNKLIFQNKPALQQWLGIPIVNHQVVVGVVCVYSFDSSNFFDQNTLRLMTFISQQIALFWCRIDASKLFEQTLIRQAEQLEQAQQQVKKEIYFRKKSQKIQKVLFEINNLAMSELTENELFSKLHLLINQFLPAGNCFIAMLDNQHQDIIHFPFHSSVSQHWLPKFRKKQDGIVEHILAAQKPVLLQRQEIQAISAHSRVYQQIPRLNYIVNILQWAGVPLTVNGETIGVLNVYSDSQDNPLVEKDLRLLNFVSQHISTVIERKRAREAILNTNKLLEIKIKKHSSSLLQSNKALKKEILRRKKIEQQLTFEAGHDVLTGAPNRKLFIKRLHKALEHQRYHQHMVALLFIDLDGFKQINDTLGHDFGDYCLVEVTQRLNACIRSNDQLGRFGGDEFVIVLDNLRSQSGVKEVANRILTVLSNPFMYHQQHFKISASIGIAISNSDSNESGFYQADADTLITYADNAMYQAKSNGKDCYVVSDINTKLFKPTNSCK